MDIKQIRKANLFLLLAEEAKLGGIRGSKKRMAEKADTAPAYLSQLIRANCTESIGHDFARRLEKAYSLPHGWMDVKQNLSAGE